MAEPRKLSSRPENRTKIILMFERYTEQARRVIFFSRYEASQCGSPCIETEHLLLGLLREDKRLMYVLLTQEGVEHICSAIRSRTSQEKVSTSIDMPLAQECKKTLDEAAEQADRHSDPHIGTEHLLLGLLSQKTSLAAELLIGHGVTTERVLQGLKKAPSGERPRTERPKRRFSPPPGSWPDAT
jgi:ATP-dependent Clp protease ATP-binding subunit ClpC